MNDADAAKILIRCLDLTSLGDNDTPENIEALCNKACTPYGNVAAVCIYPRFIPQVKRLLHKAPIKIATVVNFPKGGFNLSRLKEEINSALSLGADEIDAVFPYQDFKSGNQDTTSAFLHTAREACGKKTLKIILETGELQKTSLIAKATQMCIEAGADFIKTSTGKSKISATPEAANAIFETIAASHQEVGFKASGGIKTIDEAKKYLILAHAVFGPKWITPHHFRIGASSLLNNLLEVIKKGI